MGRVHHPAVLATKPRRPKEEAPLASVALLPMAIPVVLPLMESVVEFMTMFGSMTVVLVEEVGMVEVPAVPEPTVAAVVLVLAMSGAMVAVASPPEDVGDGSVLVPATALL